MGLLHSQGASATSLDADVTRFAHPSFVPILNSLSSDEAKILKLLAWQPTLPVVSLRGTNATDRSYRTRIRNYSHVTRLADCEQEALGQAYVNNWVRLGICKIADNGCLTGPGLYEALMDDPDLAESKQEIVADGYTADFVKKILMVTTYGKQFCDACVVDSDGGSTET